VRPSRVDVLIASALFAAAVAVGFKADGNPGIAVVVCVSAVLTLPLALRHMTPLLTVALVVCGVLLLVVADVNAAIVPVACVALAAFTAARELRAPRAQIAMAIAIGWLPLAYLMQRSSTHLEDVFVGTTIFAGAWWLGRTLRARADELDQERAQLEQARHASEEQARDEERARIARELHDIVSHSVSVITIQAESVRRRLHPDQAVEAERLRDIETAARHAMVELRRLLGTLRHGDEPAPLEPQPGLDQLPRLIERTNDAGIPVDLKVVGDTKPLPAGVDLAAYRIVQEALTNTLRHANATRAEVRVEHSTDQIRVQITDNGRGTADAPAGRGLIGMHERVALLGGHLDVKNLEHGGLLVDATLPTRIGARA
jgi:signal transduction histidine kinase